MARTPKEPASKEHVMNWLHNHTHLYFPEFNRALNASIRAGGYGPVVTVVGYDREAITADWERMHRDLEANEHYAG